MPTKISVTDYEPFTACHSEQSEESHGAQAKPREKIP
jgi:hypothetical protein